MPRYDYKCNQCGYVFEKTKPMAQSADNETCQKCGGEAKRYYIKSPNMNMLFPGSSAYEDFKKKYPLA